jgi:hypothetical protein
MIFKISAPALNSPSKQSERLLKVAPGQIIRIPVAVGAAPPHDP